MIQSARHHKVQRFAPSRPTRNKGARLVNSAFQWKYTGFLFLGVMLCLLVFILPSWYMVRSNYQLFSDLAFDTQPTLVSNLEREVHLSIILFVVSIVSTAGLSIYLGIRMTGNLISPLSAVEKQIKKMTTGDFHAAKFNYRASDDFLQLLESFSYLYETLRAQAESELAALHKIAADPKDRESLILIQQMMEIKRSQLGAHAPEATVVELFVTDEQRRAS
jgi:hypothetical protein